MNMRAAMGYLTSGCLTLLLTGCESLTWQKAGADRAAAAGDMQECHQRAVLASSKLGLASTVNPMPDSTQQGLMSECMRAKGYRLEK